MIERDLAFVGDIHGRDDLLRLVLEKLGGARRLVFLGDYVNRGPNSREVLGSLLAAKRKWPDHVVLLRGNHDQSILDFLEGGPLSAFMRMGGLATVASYTEDVGEDVRSALQVAMPDTHVALLENLEDFYEDDEVVASHCGLDPAQLNSRDRTTVALSSHPTLFHADLEGFAKTIVCGHYVQRNMQAHITTKLVALDTGCGSIPKAPLTVFLWPERSLMTIGSVDAECS